MKNISLKVDDTLHEQITSTAAREGLSLADAVRFALQAYCVGDTRRSTRDSPVDPSNHIEDLRAQIRVKDTQIEMLAGQVEEANRRHSETQHAAEEASKRHDTIVLQMTTQLDRTTTQLEDIRTRQQQSWWSRMFSSHKERDGVFSEHRSETRPGTAKAHN